MALYKVLRREVWVQPIDVESSSESEAIHKVWMGEGILLDGQLEFSHILAADTWTVEQSKGGDTNVRQEVT
jgi:hypothetical protein